MDLYLFPEDFKGVFDEIRSQFQMAPEYDGGTLFAYKYGTLRNGEMEFGLGSEDTALFYHHHPLDAEDYNSISVRSLYEELVLLRKNKITESDIIYEDWRQGRVINIGKMVEKREVEREALLNKAQDQLNTTEKIQSKVERVVLTERKVVVVENESGNAINRNNHDGIVSNLESRMKNADWFYDYSDDYQVRRKGENEFRNIMDDLENLSRQPNGKELVRNLWDKYGPNRKIKYPDFLQEAYLKVPAKKIKEKEDHKNEIKRPNFLKSKTSEKNKRKLRLR